MLKIALINLPNPGLAEPWSNFPLGLGYVAASIEERGYDIEVLDYCEGIGLIPYCDIYGIQITAPQVDIAEKLAEHLKAYSPSSLIIGGGPQMLVDRKRFIDNPNFDSIVIGEGEFSFYELIRHYELNGKVDQEYWNPPIKLLDDISFPARRLFSNFKENALRTHQLLKGDYIEGGQTTIIASRGCPWECSFCAPHSRKLRFRSPQNVVDEIRQVIEQFGIYQFKWQDDTFTSNKKWVLKLCELLNTELPQTYHRAHTRVDVFDEDMAKAMWMAGFRILCFGIESFDQRLLDINNKAIKVDQILSSLAIAKKYGFKTIGFLIFGMPGENRKSVDITKTEILKNKNLLDYLNLATMVPLPGTPIYNDPDKFFATIIESDMSKYWIVNHDVNDDILVKTNGVSIEEMKLLKIEMYKFMRDEGYARPEWKK